MLRQARPAFDLLTLAAALALAVVLGQPSSALAATDYPSPDTQITAVAGELWTGTAEAPSGPPPWCTDIRDVSIYWGDGTPDVPATSATLVLTTFKTSPSRCTRPIRPIGDASRSGRSRAHCWRIPST